MNAECCPMCQGSAILAGSVGSPGYMSYFVPRNMPIAAWSVPCVPLTHEFRACLSCGHVWSSLRPRQLRALVEAHGRELDKQYLEFLDAGPDRDLPDVPLAREAGRCVAEIDALAVAGHQAEATRRYRQLKQATWDEAVNTVRHWPDLERAQKLALFGWAPKEKEHAPTTDLLDHPMRDRLLDG